MMHLATCHSSHYDVTKMYNCGYLAFVRRTSISCTLATESSIRRTVKKIVHYSKHSDLNTHFTDGDFTLRDQDTMNHLLNF